MANINGWGRGTWGEGAWGEALSVTLTAPSAATGSTFDPTEGNIVVAKANVFPTGQSATGSVGSLSVIAKANVTPTGQSATSALGTTSVTADANTTIVTDGDTFKGLTELGSVSTIGKANITPDGQEATGAVSGVGVNGKAVVALPSLNGSVGSVTVSVVADANATPAGQEVTSALGTVTPSAAANTDATGQDSTSALGSISLVTNNNISVTGQSATGSIGLDIPTFAVTGDAQLSTAVKKFGSASLLLDGTGDSVKTTDNFTPGAGDFTFEFFVYANDVNDGIQWVFDNRNGVSNGLLVYIQSGFVNLIVDGVNSGIGAAITSQQFTAISVVRSGTSVSMYVGGTSAGSATFTRDVSDRGYAIGAGLNAANSLDGYIDEFRASNVARYTANYTVQSSEFITDANTQALLHFDGANGSTTIVNDASPVTILLNINVSITGVEGTGQLGTPTPRADANVSVSGVEATGAVGKFLIWSRIDESQTPNYTNVTDTQNSGFAQINENQSPSWKEVA